MSTIEQFLKPPELDAAISTRAPSATALSTTQWTNTRAGYLDNLELVGSPVTSQVLPSSSPGLAASLYTLAGQFVQSSYVTDTNYVDVLSVSGAGVLTFAMLTQLGAGSVSGRIEVDGSVIATSTLDATTESLAMVGCVIEDTSSDQLFGIACEEIRFNSSLKLQVKRISSPAGGYMFYRYRLGG